VVLISLPVCSIFVDIQVILVNRSMSFVGRRLARVRGRQDIFVGLPVIGSKRTFITRSREIDCETDGPHVPVLLNEVLEGFEPLQVRSFVDGTLGAGGHTRAVLENHLELNRSIGFDRDPSAHALAASNVMETGVIACPLMQADGIAAPVRGMSVDDRYLIPIHGNFSEMRRCLEDLHGFGWIESGKVDAILLDLGVSSMQLDIDERGFSFMKDGPLDMRMDPTADLTAEVAVNTWPEAKLGQIIKDFGEERYWKSISRRIVDSRMQKPILTTMDLVNVIGTPGGAQNFRRSKGKQKKAKHPATRVFQALRIAINGELEAVSQVVPDAIEMLRPGGRLAVITFHSLEDRIVKWAFRQAAGMAPSDSSLPEYCAPFEQAFEAKVKIITRKPICPSEEEERTNVRSRSAKLRIIEKL